MIFTSHVRPVFGAKSRTLFRQFYPLGGVCRSLWTHETNKGCLHVSEEVQEALNSGKGIVALESTIITHGMPYPHNFSTALSVERKVRENGSVPATIAVLDGQLRIGLSDTELILLAEKSPSLVKISRRDLSHVLSQGLSGGTTVSGTMIAAHMSGIPVFATGGIGGVHRGAETNFDISADLTELGRTPVAVVSSGVKSILDIGKTLEYLETQGVFVSTFGESKNFPAFFTRDSGHLAPYNVPSALNAAQIIDQHQSLNLKSGLLFAVPIPTEFSLPRKDIDGVIEKALDMARKQGITGKAVTPFILEEVNKLTAGSSLHANIALIESNAIVASTIARCLSLMRRGMSTEEIMADSFVSSMGERTSSLSQPSTSNSTAVSSSSSSSSVSSRHDTLRQRERMTGRPVVIGATVIDFLVQVKDENFKLDGVTYPGKVFQSFGGVGRNLADCMSRLGMDPAFVSVVGKDSHSVSMFAGCQFMDLSGVQKLSKASTATYCPVLDPSGQLLLGVGDMDINAQFDASKVSGLGSTLSEASMVMLDCNFSHGAIAHVVTKCKDLDVPVWLEPTDAHKCKKIFMSDAWLSVTFTSPNLSELKVMHKTLMDKLGHTSLQVDYDVSEESDLSDIINTCVSLCRDLAVFIPVVLLTLGRHGVLLCHTSGDVSHLSLDSPGLQRHSDRQLNETKFQSNNSQFCAWYYPALGEGMEEPSIASVSGTGDCVTSAFVKGLHQGKSLDSCVKMGLLAASLSLRSHRTVPDSINVKSVNEDRALAWGRMKKVDVTLGWEQ